MTNFKAIDFGTIELPSNFKVITYDADSMTYMNIKRKLERYEGTNDFGRWFCLNLEINDYLLCWGASFDYCLSLAYLLKKVEESNEELKELVRTWREDESKLSSVTKFLINNALIIYYTIVTETNSKVSFPGLDIDNFNKFVLDYNPRLLKSSDFVKIPNQNNPKLHEKLRLKTGLDLINRINFGFETHKLYDYITYRFSY